MSFSPAPRSWRPARAEAAHPTSNSGAYLEQAAACQAAAIATRDRLTQSLLEEEASLWCMLAAQSEAIASLSCLLSDSAAAHVEPAC